MNLDKAIATQLANIQAKTGKSLEQLAAMIFNTGLQKHSEKVTWLKVHLGIGHGDANTLVHTVAKLHSPSAETGDPLDEVYSGPKAHMRPIHEAIMAELGKWGDFDVHPKKGYVALRRKKQFVMIGPATNSRFEVGINAKELSGSARLLAQAPGGMCQYKVSLSDASEVDDELFGYIKTAYEASK
jgi:hypothetical protein